MQTYFCFELQINKCFKYVISNSGALKEKVTKLELHICTTLNINIAGPLIGKVTEGKVIE